MLVQMMDVEMVLEWVHELAGKWVEGLVLVLEDVAELVDELGVGWGMGWGGELEVGLAMECNIFLHQHNNVCNLKHNDHRFLLDH
jgi:hypothetical protein